MNPSLGIEELLTQREFLRRLARGLLGDEALAEDVLQEVELRVLEGKRPEASSRGWLVTVTRRVALNALRTRRRQAHHERSAARSERVESHDEALAGIELQRGVLAAVNGLREPYRSVVWQRYYEGRTPAEIAVQLSLPVATVKTRLQRALAELRAELDRTCGGERRAWVVLLVPLARGRTSSTGVLAALGGALVMKKVTLALVAIGLLWLGWNAWPARERAPATPIAGESPARAAGKPEVAGTRSEGARVPALGTALDAREPKLEAGPASLTLHVLWERDGSDAAGVGLALWPESDDRPELRVRRTTSDATGRARLTDLAPGRYRLHTDRDGREPLELAPGEARALEVHIPRGIDVAGKVIDEQGAPVAEAEIWLEAGVSGILGGHVAALSDHAGAFSLRSVSLEQALAAYRPERGPSTLERLRDKLESDGEGVVRVTLVLGRPREPLRGVVLDARGRPLPGALVALGEVGNSSHRTNDGRWVPQVKARVFAADPSGRFETSWIAGENEPVHVLAPEHALCAVFQPAGGAEGGELEVHLVRGSTIAGIVRAAGKPVAGASVRVVSAGSISSACPFVLPRAVSAADGSYRLEHVPPGRVDLWVTLRGARTLSAREQRELVDGGLEPWELELTPDHAITGRALDRSGKGLAKAQIVVRRASVSSVLDTDAEGRFVLPTKDAEQSHTLELVVGGSVRARREGVRAGDEVELVADPGSVELRGRFMDAVGRARDGERTRAFLRAEAQHLIAPTADVASDGSFSFPDVAPGRYRVCFQNAGAEIAWSDWFEVASGRSLDLGLVESH